MRLRRRKRHDCAKAGCRCSFGEHMDAAYSAVPCPGCRYSDPRQIEAQAAAQFPVPYDPDDTDDPGEEKRDG